MPTVYLCSVSNPALSVLLLLLCRVTEQCYYSVQLLPQSAIIYSAPRRIQFLALFVGASPTPPSTLSFWASSKQQAPQNVPIFAILQGNMMAAAVAMAVLLGNCHSRAEFMPHNIMINGDVRDFSSVSPQEWFIYFFRPLLSLSAMRLCLFCRS